ncbi:MAG: tol-pal system protein YbgF [Sulfuriferula sp.]|nr:tol-pal system protein YbgF [Sulfuriferula sp.]
MRIKSVSRLVLGLIWLVAASTASAMDDETTRRFADIQQQLSVINQRLSALESQPQGSGLLTLQSQIDALKAEVSRLHGQLDVQTHDIETTQKRQTDLYQDLDTRLRNMVHDDAAAASASASTAAAAAPASTAKSANAGEEQSYQAALALFKQGNYAGAITGFKQFVKTYPNSGMAPSAQYWIGNAYFSTKDFKNALLTQKNLISTYPASAKVPDAMLNMSSAQIELGDMNGARKTLETLVSKYAATSAAGLAKKRLELLK